MSRIVLFSIIYISSVLISSISQIMLKKSAMKKYSNKISEYINPLVVTAYAIFFISTFITIYALKFVPLSMGPILESTGYIFIVILSYFFLKEKLSKRKLLGMFIIFFGIIIVSL